MPFDRRIKGVLDQYLDLIAGQGNTLPLLQGMADAAAGYVLVLEVDLVVEEGHDEGGGGAAGAALLALVAADGVVRVDGAGAVLVEAAEDGVDVVGEEALLVEDGGEPLRAGRDADGLAVPVPVHLADGVEPLLQRLPVRREPHHRQHDVRVVLRRRRPPDLEHLRRVPRVDAVAGRQTGVAGYDGEVGAGYGERRAAIIGISITWGVA